MLIPTLQSTVSSSSFLFLCYTQTSKQQGKLCIFLSLSLTNCIKKVVPCEIANINHFWHKNGNFMWGFKLIIICFCGCILSQIIFWFSVYIIKFNRSSHITGSQSLANEWMNDWMKILGFRTCAIFLRKTAGAAYLTIKKLCDLETTLASDRTINSTHFWIIYFLNKNMTTLNNKHTLLCSSQMIFLSD